MGLKLKEILKTVKVGVDVSKIFVPGGVGKVLDVVSQGLDEKNPDVTLAAALKEMAEANDEQTQAIMALHERVKRLEAKS